MEQVFAAVEDGCKRGVKNLKASMANLQCLSIRAVEQKVTANEKRREAGETDRARAVKLGVEDFEGSEVRALKASVWKPTSFSGRPLVDDWFNE